MLMKLAYRGLTEISVKAMARTAAARMTKSAPTRLPGRLRRFG